MNFDKNSTKLLHNSRHGTIWCSRQNMACINNLAVAATANCNNDDDNRQRGLYVVINATNWPQNGCHRTINPAGRREKWQLKA